MFRNLTFKILSNFILLVLFCTGQVAAAPNNGANQVKGNSSSSNASIASSSKTADLPVGLTSDDWIQVKTLLPVAPPATAQQAYLKASNTDEADYFGYAVSLSGNTLVVGAPYEASNATGVNGNAEDNSANASGAVYVFVRSGTTWSQQAYLKASNAEAGDTFGSDVSLSGDTLVVGAYNEDSNSIGVNGDQVNNLAANSGAAYVFTRSGITWSQQAYLKASNTDALDYFGWNVAVDGDTLIIGAHQEASNAIGVNGDQANNSTYWSGAAYVFTRSGITWSQQAYLKASNTDAYDNFGRAVSLSGNTIVVGAFRESSNAIGVGGNQANNLAIDSGAAYVFTRSGITWSQEAYLKASNTGSTDYFGIAVSISDDTLVVSTDAEDSNAIGVNGDQANNSANGSGAVYVFTRSGATWSQQAYLKASNTGAGDAFGTAVSISGNTVVVGAYNESSNAIGVNGDQANNLADGSGAAYVFTRSGTTWSQQAYLKASNTEFIDNFGWKVAIDGDTLVVVTPWEDSNATGVNGDQANNSALSSGAAYAFVFGNNTATLPFLDLPFQYTNFSEAAKGRNAGGYVNSWFDHTSPGNINAVSNLTTWLGPYTGSVNIGRTNCNTPPGGFGISCYNGHDGIDFKHVTDEVLAAAPGIVWKKGFEVGGFGNYLYVDHQNCYASFYAHLKNAPTFEAGDPIVDRQQVGIMGNTGGGGGVHLHFGLYYDPTCDGDFSDRIVVDPYGWSGIGLDPWTTGPSRYLWKYAYDFTQQSIDNSGGSVSTPSGNLAVTVPAGAVSIPITLELWDTPPVAGASATLRSTGNSFWMRVLEWLTGGSSFSLMASASTNSFDVPVTVIVDYDPSMIPHLNTNQAIIYQWDDIGQAWVALSTTLDTVNKKASAQTGQPGYFDLQAPLICPADTLEPNDNYDGANVVQVNGTPTNNLFDITQDEDWFKINAVEGKLYAIQTTNLAAGVDTALEIYDTDGVTLLASNDNGEGGNASSLTWQASQSGFYFARVKQAVGSSFGCISTYNFSVVNTTIPRAPILRSPRTNVTTTDTTPTFWWTNVVGGQTYEIVFATNSAFTTNVNSHTVNGSSYTVTSPFNDGKYFWRVRARNVDNQPGRWSSSRTITIDTTPPLIPTLSSPANNTSTRRSLTFKWLNVPTAVSYQFQYDNDSNFSSPTYNVNVRSNFRRPPAMKIGTYYWRVRAKDSVGNWSAWSTPFKITISP